MKISEVVSFGENIALCLQNLERDMKLDQHEEIKMYLLDTTMFINMS